MGTPAFARPSLETLLARADARVVGVVCQPDKPRGRGLAVDAPPVKQLALAHGVPVLQPARLRDPAFQSALAALAPDLIVVAAYGKILPRAILELPPRGCINVHASLLPRHRGAAPVTWALLAGDAATGVTIMQMNEEMDAGDVLLARAIPIAADETGGSLTTKLAALGAAALGDALDGLRAGTVRPVPQPATGITFAPRIEREHCRLDWTLAAVALERQVRALAPAPAAFTTIGGKLLKVHGAAVAPAAPAAPAAAPGTVVVVGDAIVVATGDGALVLREVQLEGRKRLPAAAFLAGHPIPAGTCLGR
jgi:methionyl-tRNA formyltransferase